jgi:sec-independent protein translocase protein TatC
MPESQQQTFWEHLDELRGSLIKMIAAVLVCSVVAFVFKQQLFDVILAPQSSDFITYRLLERISDAVMPGALSDGNVFDVQLINTGLAQQFVLHIKTAFSVGLLIALPYLLYLLFSFISPALYTNERKVAVQLVGWGYVMFMLGVLLSYYLIFPLTFRFLGNYQISEVVANTVTVESYIDTLLMVSIAMGIVFEIPVLSWILGRLGILRSSVMRHYRRHVIVALLIVAAIITPTSDAFTLFLVALPMWLLFELSIFIVGRVRR